MNPPESCMYGMGMNTRCLSSLQGEKNKNRFLLGSNKPILNPSNTNTNSINNNDKNNKNNSIQGNEIHCVEYDEESNEIKRIKVFPHIQEIWGLSSSPSYPNIINTLYYSPYSYSSNSSSSTPHSPGFNSSIWRMKDYDGIDSSSSSLSEEEGELELLVELKGNQGRINKSVFHSVEGENKLATTNQHNALIYELNDQQTSLSSNNNNNINTDDNSSHYTASYDSPFISCCFDPHHSSLLVTSDNNNIRLWDLRDSSLHSSAQLSIINAHYSTIRDIDYNPNKPYHIVSGGEDRILNIFDLRKVNKGINNNSNNSNNNNNNNNRSLCQLASHSHWVWSVKYNPYHDQLILSCGTELINLWCLVSYSSAPLGELESESPTHNYNNIDQLVKTYSEHEQSIYSIAWSPHSAWLFASLSYEGKLVINHVPPNEKYKILL